MCECNQIGGPFIAEDPDCPIHGDSSRGREERIEELLEQVQERHITVKYALNLIMEEFY